MKLFQPYPLLFRYMFFAAFGMVIALSIWLRFDGLTWGLPHRLHPDEMKYVGAGAEVHGKLQVVIDEQGNQTVVESAAWNPKYFRNPPGFSYLNALWFPLWVQLSEPITVTGFDVQEPQIDLMNITQVYYQSPWNLVYGARVLAAWFGVGTTVLVFFIAYRWGGERVALVAGALNAVSFISVREAHFAVNDNCAVFFVVLAFLCVLIGYQKKSKPYFLAAAVISGLAVVSKYNMFPMILTVMIAWMGISRHQENFQWKQLILDIGLMGMLSVTTFLVICPFPIIDAPTYWAELQDLANKSSQAWAGQESVWSGFLYLETLYSSEGAIGILWSMLGMVLLVRSKRWLLLWFPILYSLLILSSGLYFARFALPVLPFMNLVAAIAMVAIVEKLGRTPLKRNVVLLLILVSTLTQPFVKDLMSNRLFHQENTRVKCLMWIAQQVNEDPTFRIAVDQFCVPFPFRGPQTVGQDLFNHMVFYDALPSDQLSQLGQLEGDAVQYIAISNFSTFPGVHDSTYEERRQAVARMAGAARPAMVFQAFDSDWVPQAADVEDTYQPIENLGVRQYPGPVIELFRLQE